jgi:N-acetylglucosamine kinase-like BadF-type ATPase
MKVFLGVDGGQSSTTAVIGDETGRILGEGSGGPCNHVAAEEGRARLEAAIRASVAGACAQAGLDANAVRFEAACLGMSGGPEDKQAILAAMLRADRLIVTTDAAIALSGATPTGQGIIVIAGTGSIAYGRDANGRFARAGGWGHIFGDEGGAFDIARQALRAALRMEEGWGPRTVLRQALLDATASRDANQALHRFYSEEWPRSRVATLALVVERAAGESDGVAAEILSGASHQLAILVGAVRGQLWRAGESVAVAYVGGVFESPVIRERFRLLVELEEGNTCAPPLYSPAEGALLEAYRAAGLQTGLALAPR